MKKKYYLIAIGLALALSVYAVQATGIFVRFADSDTVYKAYQTAQQFFDDGGAKDFSNVQVVGQEQSFGSVSQTSEYNATSTAPNALGFLQSANPLLLKTGFGTFGSYIVTKAGAVGGTVNFYNATTTNILKRTGNTATSSIIITSLPTDLAAGTYTFDLSFSKGLIMDSTGTVGTSTITFR